MLHFAISMISGRVEQTKQYLAARTKDAQLQELSVPEIVISIFIRDAAKEDWREEITRIDESEMLFRPDCCASDVRQGVSEAACPTG